MFVCIKCHEADEKVLNCNIDIHIKMQADIVTFIKGKCDICGKQCRMLWCGKYTEGE
jgi:hypothetical protein